ncbi:MAG: hypothetical protein KIT79_04595 [Deltaproteobacteria bacterium]|nr:hypothetical protein [Deltaproteobacteria bacterium]
MRLKSIGFSVIGIIFIISACGGGSGSRQTSGICANNTDPLNETDMCGILNITYQFLETIPPGLSDERIDAAAIDLFCLDLAGGEAPITDEDVLDDDISCTDLLTGNDLIECRIYATYNGTVEAAKARHWSVLAEVVDFDFVITDGIAHDVDSATEYCDEIADVLENSDYTVNAEALEP